MLENSHTSIYPKEVREKHIIEKIRLGKFLNDFIIVKSVFHKPFKTN